MNVCNKKKSKLGKIFAIMQNKKSTFLATSHISSHTYVNSIKIRKYLLVTCNHSSVGVMSMCSKLLKKNTNKYRIVVIESKFYYF